MSQANEISQVKLKSAEKSEVNVYLTEVQVKSQKNGHIKSHDNWEKSISSLK